MATPTMDLNSIKSWLTKQASLPEKEDEGKPATTGAHDSQNDADAKKAVPGVTVTEAKKNPDTGSMNNPVPGSGLLQATTGAMPEVENAVKTVTEESEKAANADLSTEEGFATAVAAIRKAAAELPLVFAQAGIKIDAPKTPTKAAGTATKPVDVAAQAKQAQDAQAAALIDGYRKLGADRGAVTAEYLKAFHGTYAELVKMAEDGSMEAMLASDPSAQGGPPPADAGAPPAAPPAPPAGPDAGGPPGAPPGGDPAAGGGQPSLDDVAAALAEMGMTPDELMQIAQKMKGEVEAAPAPDAGGPPAEEKAAAAKEMTFVIKTAGDAKALMRSGGFNLKPAGDAAARKRRDAAKAYIRELQAVSAS